MATADPKGAAAYRAGRLIQWGLNARARPAQEPEYRELLDRYLDEAAFRSVVQEVSRGLGLTVLDVGENGLVLGPEEGSVFALRASEFRPTSSSVDDRLLDGLVQVGIAATVFPRPADLEEDSVLARPPVTLEEIEDLLETLCERLRERAAEEPDPPAEDQAAGLTEAWRVYRERASAGKSDARRASRRTIRGTIQYNLERLREMGCFTRHERRGRVEWQPTWRYQVQVKELAATRVYQQVWPVASADDEPQAARE